MHGKIIWYFKWPFSSFYLFHFNFLCIEIHSSINLTCLIPSFITFYQYIYVPNGVKMFLAQVERQEGRLLGQSSSLLSFTIMKSCDTCSRSRFIMIWLGFISGREKVLKVSNNETVSRPFHYNNVRNDFTGHSWLSRKNLSLLLCFSIFSFYFQSQKKFAKNRYVWTALTVTM